MGERNRLGQQLLRGDATAKTITARIEGYLRLDEGMSSVLGAVGGPDSAHVGLLTRRYDYTIVVTRRKLAG